MEYKTPTAKVSSFSGNRLDSGGLHISSNSLLLSLLKVIMLLFLQTISILFIVILRSESLGSFELNL